MEKEKVDEKKQKQRGLKQGFELIYKYRFVLSFLLLIMLVSFKISGSSMGCWKLFLGDGESGIRLGEPRVWRSDEWGTLTPLCFRQQYNTLGAYNRYSQTLGSILTDNMLVYGQPSWDILTLFRPFYWGYLFWGSERGLSWFWCSRLIVLFLSWFELGMLITDGQKKLSVMLSVCVSFAPFLQWWFAINGLVEMLIYGACFVLGSNYLVSHAFNPRKIAVEVGMAVCAVGYVLTFYPTWMVPVAWGFVPLFLWVVIWKFNRNVLRRVDVVPWLLIFVITAAGLTVLAVTSWDVIKAELNSVYPGNAPSSSGGTGLWWMMKYPISLVSRFSMNELIVENSSIICFAPAGFILALWVIIKEKKKDPLLILLLGMNLFLAWYYCVGIPKWLAKMLLLSFVNSNRGPQVLGFLRLTLFVRAVALKEKAPKRWLAALAAVISSAVPMRLALGFTKYEPGGLRYEYFDTAEKIVVVWAILAVVFYLLYRARKSKYTMAVLGVCTVVLASSIWINPVAKGVPEITKSETMQQIRDLVKEDPKAIWLVVDMAYPATNIPAMAGADCLNTTQTYPQKTRWEMLNQEGECEDIYNRYCHIRASLGSKTMLELVSTDYVEVTLSPEDLKKLNIRYIVSTNDFDEKIAAGITNIFTDSGIEFQKYYEGAQLSIFRCVY